MKKNMNKNYLLSKDSYGEVEGSPRVILNNSIIITVRTIQE